MTDFFKFISLFLGLVQYEVRNFIRRLLSGWEKSSPKTPPAKTRHTHSLFSRANRRLVPLPTITGIKFTIGYYREISKRFSVKNHLNFLYAITVVDPFLHPFFAGNFFARFFLVRKSQKGTVMIFQNKNYQILPK